jgi:hypothetical protein
MAGARLLVEPPTFDLRKFGLLSVVQDRSTAADQHWQNGVTWQDLCGMAGTTYSGCLSAGTVTTTGGAKSSNVHRSTFGATPFAVVAELDCSPVGYSDQERQADAAAALTRNEAFQVEGAFWTGRAGGDAGIVFPHLASAEAVVDPNITIMSVTLQCAASTVSGSVVLDVVEGLQRLEYQMAQCYSGQLTLHVPSVLGEALIQWGVIAPQGEQMLTKTGHLVALGGGYPGTSPSGVATPNVAWVYATGPVFMYRGAPETFRFYQMLDRTNNTLKAIVERPYVLGYSCCCLGAVPLALGGDITGQPLSPN